jgi:release factor glutamine methyltransferase
VNRDVLIPRPETEILVDTILKEIGARSLEIWDLCTGSGCIGIALKKRRPDCHVILADISAKALEVAKKNAAGVEVEIVQGDLLAPFQGRKADVLVCNPPYISEKEYIELDREVRDWEPKQALVAGPTGYEFYERLARELPPYLKPGAKVYFEIGQGMGEGVRKFFNHPFWKKGKVVQDWSSLDRYYILETE